MTEFAPFDVADYLDSEEMIVEYMTLAARDEDPRVFLAALSDVARARGMTEVAAKAGLGRESLYKSLSGARKPRFDTVRSVLAALGLGIAIVPLAKGDGAEAKTEPVAAE
jgi:probable addiction module antidote protein